MFAHDQYDALQTRAGLLDRTARGRIELTGADRRSYLHGLLTNDIAALAPGGSVYAALLTPQGRMVSDMRVSELGDKVLIDQPRATADTVRQRLADFVFSEDVDVQDVSSSLAHFGLYGPLAADVLATLLSRAGVNAELSDRQKALDDMAVNTNASWQFDNAAVTLVRSDDYGVPGFEIFVNSPHAAELAGALVHAGTLAVSPETVEVCRVEAGRPEFGVDMDEHTIPLEAGIEDRAISLTKGCYVGQEIIIRVLHRGQGRVAKHLVGFAGEPSDPVAHRGDRFRINGKDVGVVTSAVTSVRLQRPIGLGYVHRDHAEPGSVLEVGGTEEPGRTVTVVTVPFSGTALKNESGARS